MAASIFNLWEEKYMCNTNRWLIVLMAAGIGFGINPASRGATKNWTGLSGTDWSDSGNWSPVGVPGASDDVVFNLASTYNVREIYGTSYNSLTVSAGNVNLDLGYQVHQLTDNLIVAGGFGGSAALTITDVYEFHAPGGITIGLVTSSGTLTLEESGFADNQYYSSNVKIGSVVGSSGTLNITDSVEINADEMNVGGGTSGVLNVTSNGYQPDGVNISNTLNINSTGTANLNGYATVEADTLNLNGALNINASTAGINVANTANINSFFAHLQGDFSAGTLNLNNTYNLSGGNLTVGDFTGPGSFVWNSGSLYDTNDLYIDNNNGYLPGAATLTNGRHLSVAGLLAVGVNQGGSLSVVDFTDVTSATGRIGGAAADGQTASVLLGVDNYAGWYITNGLTMGDDVLAELRIEDGTRVRVGYTSQFSSGDDPLANAYISTVPGGVSNITIDGANSYLEVANNLYLGGDAAGPKGGGTLELTNGDGLVDNLVVGGVLKVWDDYTLDAVDGTALFSSLDVAGIANFGTRHFDTVAEGITISTSGGTLNTQSIDFGTQDFTGHGTLNARITTDADIIATGDLTLGDLNDYNAVSIAGTIYTGTHTVKVHKKGFFTLSNNSVSMNPGGVLAVPNGTILPAGATLNTGGQILSRIVTQAGSIIELQTDLTLGDASSLTGINFDGEVYIYDNLLTLNDANDAVLGTLTVLGNGLADQGYLAASNGITLPFGHNIAGYGTVTTPDDPFTPLINNGAIVGGSLSEPITLTGYIKGAGTLDNVVITGTDAPGFSPATVYRGSVAYAGSLEIELGGTSPGSFDRIIHAGLAQLGGDLDVLLINGFSPTAGDNFDVLDWSSISGAFASINLPALPGGLAWDTSNLLIDGTLAVLAAQLPGDLNADGFVGIDDLNLVLANWNQNVPPGDPLADPSGDGFVGIDDLNTVLGNWNAGTPPSLNDSATSVPEPACVWLAAIGLIELRRRARVGQ